MSTLTLIHVLFSLAVIAAGIGMSRSLLTGQLTGLWSKAFLVLMAPTLLTSFLFGITGFTPGLAIAALSVVIFVPCAAALYRQNLRHRGRSAFIVGMLLLFYFDCLVLVVQAYQKIPALNALAPMGNEPPVAATQIVVLLAFIALGYGILKRARWPHAPA